MLAQLNDCTGGLLHLGPNVITFRTLLHLGQLLHLGLQHSCSPNFSFVSRWTHADVWTNTAIMCVGRMQYALTLEYSSLVSNIFFKTLFCFCFVVWFNILLQYCIWPRISIYFGLGLEYLCHFYLRLYSILSTCSVFLDIDVRKTVISLHKCCNFFFFEVGRHVIYHLYYLMYSIVFG